MVIPEVFLGTADFLLNHSPPSIGTYPPPEVLSFYDSMLVSHNSRIVGTSVVEKLA